MKVKNNDDHAMELKPRLAQQSPRIRIRSYSEDISFPSDIDEKKLSQSIPLDKQNHDTGSFQNLSTVKTVIINL